MGACARVLRGRRGAGCADPVREKVSVAAAPGRATFQAYGREFTLELANNSRLLSKLSAQRKADLAQHRFLRGTLVGVEGSWVRLSQIGHRQLGAFWTDTTLHNHLARGRASQPREPDRGR